jgi:histidyl-tRNA synthetase
MDAPSLPKGTRDFGPFQMMRRQFIMKNITMVFANHGFMPLETPAMENLSTLTGKYGEEGDQLLFKILNTGDFLKEVDQLTLSAKESRAITSQISEKGLRYDLTVPFARYVVMNRHDITLPFKRYQLQPVWRADRPQKGRYREFYQCDADVVGTDSLICEAEIIQMIRNIFSCLKIKDYSIKINHRGILSGLAEVAGAKDNEMSLFIGIDKLDKIGVDKVKDELQGKGFTWAAIQKVFDVLQTAGTTHEKLSKLNLELASSSEGKRGVNDLTEVFALLKRYDTSEEYENIDFDISLARGLSYYTGCIFEIKIGGVAIGSVSGGGRYDNLTQAFGAKEKLSGVGISFGIDRIYDAMEALNLFEEPVINQSGLHAVICHFDETARNYGLGVLDQLRRHGIAVEIYPDLKKIQKQLEYVNKRRAPFAIVIGSDEMKSGKLTLKSLASGQQQQLDLNGIIEYMLRNDS